MSNRQYLHYSEVGSFFALWDPKYHTFYETWEYKCPIEIYTLHDFYKIFRVHFPLHFQCPSGETMLDQKLPEIQK